ncbi:MAG: hypothetical protein INQ03_02655 [Candidatus Heimdallarchaeota archaeon]|nr:hypothetical protein [Candidatus Heimdallarchaeota archaeon]
MENILHSLYENKDGKTKNQIKKELELKSFTKTMYQPLLDLGLIAQVIITDKKNKSKSTNGLRITEKGINYIEVARKKDPSIEMVKMNSLLINLQNTTFELLQKTEHNLKLIEEVSLQLADLKASNSVINLKLSFNLIADVIQKYMTSTLPMVSSERVIRELEQITGLSKETIKKSIRDLYMEGRLDFHEGNIKNEEYLITTDDGSRFAYIELR